MEIAVANLCKPARRQAFNLPRFPTASARHFSGIIQALFDSDAGWACGVLAEAKRVKGRQDRLDTLVEGTWKKQQT